MLRSPDANVGTRCGKIAHVRIRVRPGILTVVFLAASTLPACGSGAAAPVRTPLPGVCGDGACPVSVPTTTVPPGPRERAVFTRWCSLSSGDTAARVTAIMGAPHGDLVTATATVLGATDIGVLGAKVTLSEWDSPGVQFLVRFVDGRVNGLQAFAATRGESPVNAYFSLPADLPCAIDR